MTDAETGSVLVRAANGRVTARLEHAGRPLSVAVDAADRVYVGDAESGAITVYDAEWVPLFQLGRGPGEVALPGDIAIDPETGRVYVADSGQDLIKVYSSKGEFILSFGGTGASEGQFNFPAAIFLDPVSRELLVSDQLNFRLQVFDLDGSFLCYIGGSGSSPGSFFQGPRSLHVPQGLWVDGDGLIYVADASEGRVRVLDRDGSELGHIGEFGAGPGQLRVPMDVAMDGYGRLFVAASNNSRLEVFGIAEFADPETILPALVSLLPNPFDTDAGASVLTAVVAVPGYRIAEIDTGSVAANDHPAVAVVFGDRDRDLVAELHAEFDAAALIAGYPADEPLTVTVTGELGGMRFEGTALLEVLAGTPADQDKDGVGDDWDDCPDTAPDRLVDAAGCAVEQLCPCRGPWKNHGHYVACVASVSRELLEEVAWSAPKRRSLRAERIAVAARSTCGEKRAKNRERRRAAKGAGKASFGGESGFPWRNGGRHGRAPGAARTP